MPYSNSYAKEERINKAARRMGYTSRKEVALVLGQPYFPRGTIDVSGGSERQLIEILEKAIIRKHSH